MVNILKHVDVLEFMRVDVYVPSVYRPGEIMVDLVALEEGKAVIVDEDALKTLNQRLTEKCQEFEDARDPRVKKYIEEFVARMCSEWHRAGLLVVEDAPESPDDPYETAKKKVQEELRRKGHHA